MTDSRIERARKLLAHHERGASPWSALGAAALAATAAVMMAGIMVLGPGVRFEDPTMIPVQSSN